MQQPVDFQYKSKDSQLPTHLFTCITQEWVDCLLENIDGMKIFKIKYFPRERVEKRMLSSGRKGLIGMRKVGRCIGNLYCPLNECPFKVLACGKRNTSNFKNVEAHNICFSCGHLANREGCMAWKIIGYCRVSQVLTVYHLGMHTCLS